MRPIGTVDFTTSLQTERIDDETWVLPVPIAHAQPKYTLSYILRDTHGDLHLIDTGVDTPENRRHLVRSLLALGGIERIRSITATHGHADHLGLAGWVREVSGAMIRLHREDRPSTGDPGLRQEELSRTWGVPVARHRELADAARIADKQASALAVDHHIADDARLEIPGRSLAIVRTPGHTSGHIALFDPTHELLFSGDALLPHINPGFGLDAGVLNPLALDDLLTSLQELTAYDDAVACPGHEYRFLGIAERAQQIALHHLKRNGLVRSAWQQDPAIDVWRVAETLPWRVDLSSMPGGYLRSALVQTALHLEYVRMGNRAGSLQHRGRSTVPHDWVVASNEPRYAK